MVVIYNRNTVITSVMIFCYTVALIGKINGFNAATKIAENGQSDSTTVSLSKVAHDILKVYRASENSKGKTVVAVVGDTGCGISTFINYLAGCKMALIKMEEINRKSNVRKSGGFMSSVVVDVADDSPIPPVAPAGHAAQSKTTLPELVEFNDTVFLDTPGYLDSRGVDFRISNAVNLRQAFHKAHEVKIVLLVQFSSLLAGRGGGVKNLVHTLCKFFGNKDVLQNHTDSILVVVTKMEPPAEGDQISVENLRKDFAYLLATEFASLSSLSQRLVLYDPLDRDDRQYKHITKRDDLLLEIENLKSIVNPSKVFLTSLNSEELDALLVAEDSVIANVLESLERGNIGEASKYFQVMKVLQSIVKNEKVSERIEVIRNIVRHVMRELNGWIRQLTPEQQELLERVGKLFDENEPFDEEEINELEKKCKNVSQFQTQFRKAVKYAFKAMLVVAEKIAAFNGVSAKEAKAAREAAESFFETVDEMWRYVVNVNFQKKN